METPEKNKSIKRKKSQRSNNRVDASPSPLTNSLLIPTIAPSLSSLDNLSAELIWELEKAGKIYHKNDGRKSGVVEKITDIIDPEEVGFYQPNQ